MRFAALAFVAAMTASADLAAQTPAQRTLDQTLVASGFVMKPANTARDFARLKTVPARRFVARSKGGVRYYIYADPEDCRCAFIGSQQAFDTFKERTATVTPPPGYRGPADTSQPSGVNPLHDIVHEQREDLDSIAADDIFHPGF